MNTTTYKNVTIIDTKNDERTTIDVAPIEGFSRYVAGSDGLVYALAKHRHGSGALEEARRKLNSLTDGVELEASPMAVRLHRGGYIRARLINDDGIIVEMTTHRIIATAFIGDIGDGMVVDHIDFDRQNNAPDNLQIITQRENVHRSIDAGRCPQMQSGKKHNAAS